MPQRSGAVHVVTTTRRYKDKVYRTQLLRRSYREGGQVKNETLGNLSHLPEAIVESIRQQLRGEVLVPQQQAFQITASRSHGAVQAVLQAMRRLKLAERLDRTPSRSRDLAVGMIVARILEPQSKLATARSWHTTTLPQQLGIEDADEDELYAAMDWLLERQSAIETQLAKRHLREGGTVLYDLSLSYFEGVTCPLAKRGHSRDRKKGTLQVNYGLLTNERGCPVAISVYEGNTGDSTTLIEQAERMQSQFGIERVVMVGDRGMISQKQIDALRARDLGWITALNTQTLRTLVEGEHLQLGLFDERNLFEIEHPDYPDERLIACRNPVLAQRRAHKRRALLDATARELEKVRAMVGRGRLRTADAIGVRVGKVVDRYKVAKHFDLTIEAARFEFLIAEPRVAAEAALDGVYVVRTCVPAEQLDAADTVRSYKRLSHVERAFRSLKTVDLYIRPIHHRLEDRVRAHIFLCMLAYYVQWHMVEAWRALLFHDEDLGAHPTRDPVAPATRSAAAEHKAAARTLEDGTAVHSFRTLLADLACIVSNTCRRIGACATEATFQILTQASPRHQHAYALLDSIDS
jgi:Transposase DDE domain